MAHEHQVKETTSDTSMTKASSNACLDVVVNWLTIYMRVYREVLSEELGMAYREALADLPDPETLHRAFLRALKINRFRPTPAEVLEAYEIEMGKNPKKQTAAPEECEKCRGTGWKMIPRADGQGNCAVRCVH